MRKLLIVLLACIPLLAPTRSWAWGCVGHQVVAYIAYENLNPNAKAHVDDLLKDVNYSVHRYCGATSLGPIETDATWADDARSSATGPWHFWDIPLGASTATLSQYCDSGCVVKALQEQQAVLQSAGAKREDQQEALMYIIHLVGDEHQPLHIVDNGDRGGNCVPISFTADGKNESPRESPAGSGNYTPNLHGIWDKDIIETMTGAGKGADRDHLTQIFADSIVSQYTKEISTLKKQPIEFQKWALETHPLAKANGYDPLPTAIPVDPNPATLKSCAGTSDKFAKLNEVADDAYVKQAQPVIKEQLAKAGARLAATLNTIWPAQ